jgi:polyhydroxyalkanoate synthase
MVERGRDDEPPSAAAFGWPAPALWTPVFALADVLRAAQGDLLAACGLGATECRYRLLASGEHWRLREYAGAGAGPPVLVVAAPIKRPYIWDLVPPLSVIRHCLRHGLRMYLLEWAAASRSGEPVGLLDCADHAIGEAVARVSREAGGTAPFLMGHSLGGTFAAIHAAIAGRNVRGLVLVSAPLCFEPGSGRFRDAIVSTVPSSIVTDVVPGSLLSQLCALASPDIFLWARGVDAVLGAADPVASAVHARVERWALDEAPLPGRLVGEIFQWLYRENRFCRGTLRTRIGPVGPASVRVPVLAVVNGADEIAPAASIKPFVAAVSGASVRVIDYHGEIGVGLQHLAVLVGRQAHAQVWPEIVSWLRARG